MSPRLFAAAVLAAVVCLTIEAKPPDAEKADARNAPREIAVTPMVFYAVLEGLYADGVSNQDVDAILAIDAKTKDPHFREHFVDCCPLCHPAFDAFVLYRSRPDFSMQFKDVHWKNNYGSGLPADVSKRLHSEKKADRLGAIQALIDGWVRRRLDSMRPTPEERAAWTKAIEAGRQQGMERLRQFQSGGGENEYTGWKGCAICDGTAGACRSPR